MRYLVGHLLVERGLSWEPMTSMDAGDEDGLTISFPFMRQSRHRDAIRTVREALAESKVDWLVPIGTTWRINFDRLATAIPTLLEGHAWACGTHVITLDVFDETPALGDRPLTFVQFIITKKEAMMTQSDRIFLSHKGSDKPRVRDFKKTLESLGLKPWFDEDARPAGANLDNMPFRLLISFSPDDHELKDQLVRHLQVVIRFAGIELWTADRVQAGEEWRREVDAALDRAHVALLLISANFLASDFLQDIEVPKLIQRREQGGLAVIPVLLRSCLWQAHPWVGALKPLPTSGQPIASAQGDERDRLLTEIVAEIARRMTVAAPPSTTEDLKVPMRVASAPRKQSGIYVEVDKTDDALWLRHLREAGLDLPVGVACVLEVDGVHVQFDPMDVGRDGRLPHGLKATGANANWWYSIAKGQRIRIRPVMRTDAASVSPPVQPQASLTDPRRQAAEQLWRAVLALRNGIPRLLHDLDYVMEDEYQKFMVSDHARAAALLITDDAIARGVFFRSSEKDIEEIRLFIDEPLWEAFSSYQSFLARASLVTAGRLGDGGPWYRDDLCLRLLRQALTVDHVARMSSMTMAKFNFARRSFESVVLERLKSMLPKGSILE